MNNEQKINFYHRHNKKLKLIGVVVSCLLVTVGTIYLNNNLNSEDELEVFSSTDIKDNSNIKESNLCIVPDNSSVQESLVIPDSEPVTISVNEHKRKLPKNHHASLQKQAEAEARGIYLSDGETIVNTYEKNIA